MPILTQRESYRSDTVRSMVLRTVVWHQRLYRGTIIQYLRPVGLSINEIEKACDYLVRDGALKFDIGHKLTLKEEKNA